MIAAALMTGLGVWIGEANGAGLRLVLGSILAVVVLVGTIAGVGSRTRSGIAGGANVPAEGRSGRSRERSPMVRLTIFGLGLLTVAGYCRSNFEWRAVSNVRTGHYDGEAILRSDPRPVGRATQAVVEIEGQRFDLWGYGSLGRRLANGESGEVVTVLGERRPLAPGTARRRHVHHVVGRFEAEELGSVELGPLSRASPMELAAHRIRAVLRSGTRTLPPQEATLFAGLVYGDDTDQPPDMTRRFRSSGLAHLTAVSGQNVAFLLALCTPLLSRMRRPLRWGVTMAVLSWFTILTRLEPSVVRAGLMAAVAATVFALGRQASSARILGAAITIGWLVDPFLAWSVGWWLSMCGAGGLIFLTPILTRRLGRCPDWAVHWLAPMVAAQIGVLPVSALVFGVPSALSIPCNLLAVPVAGIVMLIGLPAALIAGMAPEWVAHILMWPLGVGVRWVDYVAALGALLRPPPLVDRLVTALLVMATVSAILIGRRDVTT